MVGLGIVCHGDIVVLPWKAGKSVRLDRASTGSPARPAWLKKDRPTGPSTAPNRRQLGDDWEHKAAQWLQAQGLRLVARQVNYRFGEIDLIMGDGTTAVIVEVRQRSSSHYGSAADSIMGLKRRKVERAAQLWWQQHGHKEFEHLRFDVVTFEQNKGPQWLIAAWSDSAWL